jgi:glucose/arabinose dehydrogenase
MRALMISTAVALALGAAACGSAPAPESVGYGANPQIPAPHKSFLPTMKTAKGGAWPAAAAPTAPAGLKAVRFAEGLDHPRWLHVLPNGDVLVSLAATEAAKPDSIRAFFQNMVQKRVGASKPSPDQIYLLRDADGDGRAEVKSLIFDGVKQPFGMAYLDGRLYVAATDQVVRVPYQLGSTAKIAAPPQKVIDLPHGPGHWTRNLLASPDGSKLYVTVGSGSNIADKGMAQEKDRAAIWTINPDGTGKTIFAGGLRNANGMGWEPTSGRLWTVVNERDELGDNLVPDYMTSVAPGGFYGWPWSYWGKTVDQRVKPQNPDMVAKALTPDYGLGAHTASLGLTFYTADLMPQYKGGAFIGQHGSWNRSVFSGYKVVFVPFAGGRPSGPPQDVLTGFLPNEKETYGRPVGVAVDAKGALLVADDVGGIVWRVAPST